jgi:surface polysaccharide O-acyltransferase-like enzyme
MQRINWIDWAKALAVCCVVFCHLPQSQDWFYYRYLQADIITIFFFISGYLKKDHGSDKANWQKYWHSLVLPYFFYNAIVYPYWLVKFYMLNGSMPDLIQAMRPIFGALLFEHKNAFCEPLNGPLWYLPAILFMHIIIDLCRKTKHQHVIMISLCILSVILYAANKYYYFAPNLTPMGFLRRLPYYYIGYVFGQKQLFRNINKRRDLIGCITCLCISILFFQWHLHTFRAGQHILHIALFYPSNIGFLFGMLYGCKLLNNCKSQVINKLSVGTLVIIGFHIIPITATNHILELLYHINSTICYHWYEALSVTLIIVTILYPLILVGRQYTILLGKKLK